MVIVCETGFETEDKDNKGYSMLECDLYMFNPERNRRPELDHRLTVRKNLLSNRFELYRYYFSSKRIEIIFTSSDLQYVFDRGNEECNKVHYALFKGEREKDLACLHNNSQLDTFQCKFYKSDFKIAKLDEFTKEALKDYIANYKDLYENNRELLIKQIRQHLIEWTDFEIRFLISKLSEEVK